MKTLLIVYHSLTGGTQYMAQAVSVGAQAEGGVRVQLLTAPMTQAQHVLDASGYVFLCPETLGSMSGHMKDFFDRTFYAALDRIQGRPVALGVCAGSDGRNTLLQLQRICTGWRLREVAPPVRVCTHAQTPQAIAAPKQLASADLQACTELGQAMAAGLALGLF